MRVFVTGASGFIGSAVVAELRGAGHRVVGLARSEGAARAVQAAGAEVHHGSLDDLDRLRAGAAAADGVVHLGFNHDWSVPRELAARTDTLAIEAMGAALAGSERPLVIASGIFGLATGRAAVESDAAPAAGRGISEAKMLELATRGVRSAIVRLPPSVHGQGDHGFVPYLVKVAREKGVAACIGDGANRWPAVHRLDAARLFRLALEGAPAGTRLHAIADPGVPTRELAEVIGRRLGVPVVTKTAEEAGAHFGWIAPFFAMDALASSALTQERFGWRPAQPGLLADVDAHYFG
jgi:nucleoside-diphosphate-sugar epimerase